MTPDEQEMIFGMAVLPDGTREVDPGDVLRHFGTADGKELGLRLLRQALQTKDADDAEAALVVCSEFGVTSEALEPLLQLAAADWHQRHEDVVTAIGRFKDPRAVGALLQATLLVPDYLDYDDSRALATKAIWALGVIPGSDAQRALRELLDSDDAILRAGAEQQLARRSGS
ncbi:HEAT repeat domain-containing protein [Micromonospora sp. PLK6-60]|uniref:HEAT repeat domain-containing protein n=1 Tax=Micromonospora sp. PLK6-60 TaxID=2873383 RepID=UPI001CA74BB6|nr:HEAT repeat domain-containing protein [Micromonospora sp. PLK6-60]MBY8872082.1 HEAT repeat domain-containing protein [Micromonospora sp. PLK6-60]